MQGGEAISGWWFTTRTAPCPRGDSEEIVLCVALSVATYKLASRFFLHQPSTTSKSSVGSRKDQKEWSLRYILCICNLNVIIIINTTSPSGQIMMARSRTRFLSLNTRHSSDITVGIPNCYGYGHDAGDAARAKRHGHRGRDARRPGGRRRDPQATSAMPMGRGGVSRSGLPQAVVLWNHSGAVFGRQGPPEIEKENRRSLHGVTAYRLVQILEGDGGGQPGGMQEGRSR